MKLAQSLALIITGSASFFIPFALADIIIAQVQVVDHKVPAALRACASNNNNCECFEGGHGAKEVTVNGTGVGSLPESGFFSVEPGLCGSGLKYNFIRNDDGSYDFYVDGGDGISKGTCLPNTNQTTCPNVDTKIYDQLFCKSDICNA